MRIITFIFIWVITGSAHAKATSEFDFFRMPHLQVAHLSPDGSQIALLRNSQSKVTVAVRKTSDNNEFTIFTAGEQTDNEIQVQAIYWIDNETLALQLAELGSGLHNMLHTKVKRKLLLIDTKDQAGTTMAPKSVRTSGWFAHPLENQADTFIYAKSGIVSKLYQLNAAKLSLEGARLGKLDRLDGGQFTQKNEIISVNGVVLRWFFRGETPVSALALRKDGLALVGFKEKTSFDHKTWSSTDNEKARDDLSTRVLPIMLAGGEGRYYGLDRSENHSKSVYLIDYEANQYKKIYETSAFQIVDILLDDGEEFVGVTVLRDGVLVNEYTNSSGDNDTPTATINIDFDDNPQRARFIRYHQSHNKPGAYYLVERSSGELTLLGREYPELPSTLPTEQVQQTFEIDGHAVPYILNLPRNRQDSTPLVVMPHGGPLGVFDAPYFDPLTQYLATNGYAVLRVNHRGSGGYSQAFADAGKQQWGTGILRDIHDVASEVTRKYRFSPENTCLMGMSYGGYAAVSLVLKYPQSYRCAAAIAGVYDVNLYIRTQSESDQARTWFTEHVGDPETQYEQLKSISPLYHIKSLSRPLFLAHGGEDEVVDMEQAFRLRAALELHNRNYRWYFDETLQHSFSQPEAVARLMKSVTAFLEEQLL